MKKPLEKVLAAAMGAVFTFMALTGCGGGAVGETKVDNGQGETSAMEIAMGRYLEEEVLLPEGLTYLLALSDLRDGTLRVIGRDQEFTVGSVWDSKDTGNTWEKVFDITLEENQYLDSAEISPTGDTVYTIMTEHSESSWSWSYKIADKEGNIRNLDIKLSGSDADYYISRMQFDQEGDLYAYGGSDAGIYHVDKETGDILNTFSMDEYVSDFMVMENQLLAVTVNGMERYDLDSGESLVKDENLSEQLSGSAYSMSGSYPLLMKPGIDQNSMYFCNSSGLFHHVMEGSLSEQIIDATLTSLGKPSVSLIGMALLADEIYVVGVTDDTNYKILRYTYSANTPSKPSQEITIYSITDQLEVRQAISLYMKEHPDILVTMEIGMTGEDAVTTADVLKTLNTNIAAGKGPDILILDGMPVSSYMEKGLLADLSDLVGKVGETEGVYENISNIYQTGDNLYAVPARFVIPVIQGDRDILNQISDMKSLADQAEKQRKENPDIQYIMETYNRESLIETMYSFYAISLMQEDGKLNQEKVQEFYEQAMRIYDTGTEAEEDYEDFGIPSFSGGAMSIWMGMEKISAGAITNMYEFAMARSMASEMEKLSYQLVNAGSGKVFFPKEVLGINRRTQKMEEAKRFVTFLLSQEAQTLNHGSGFPINRAGMKAAKEREKNLAEDTEFTFSDENDNIKTIKISWPADEQVDTLLKEIEELDTIGLDDDTVKEIIKEQGIQCLEGSISPEKAAANLIQKVNLYLAE